MASKLEAQFNKFLWFSQRPSLYPEFVRRLYKATVLQPLGLSTITKKHEAREWCEQQAVDTEEAIYQITGSASFIPVQQKFRTVFEEAQKKADSCPVEMGGDANVDLLYWLSDHLKVQKVLETGVAYGWSSLALLLALISIHDESLLISTDMPYPGQRNDNYVGLVVPDTLKLHWQIIKQADREAIPQALKKLDIIDLCHYDSDKSYEGRMWAYPRLWNHLKSGGYFISDDIHDNYAFRDFCDSINEKPVIVRSYCKQTSRIKDVRYSGVLVKD